MIVDTASHFPSRPLYSQGGSIAFLSYATTRLANNQRCYNYVRLSNKELNDTEINELRSGLARDGRRACKSAIESEPRPRRGAG